VGHNTEITKPKEIRGHTQGVTDDFSEKV